MKTATSQLKTPTIDRLPHSNTITRATYAVTTFLSAFLLFQVELLLSDYVLPWFGGSAAVWTTTMLVFQTLLFAAYSYAHSVSVRTRINTQRTLQLILVAASIAALSMTASRWPSPITPGIDWKPEATQQPVLRLMSILLVSVGLPFFLLSTTGPLLQAWYLRVTGKSPYRLYAISNAGSLAGLLSYPFVVQPLLRLTARGWVWFAMYCLFAAGTAMCALRLTGSSSDEVPSTMKSATTAPPTASFRLFWLLLPACASIALLAGTNFISLYLVTVPLMWVVPLSFYLLSFIICFARPAWYRRSLFYPLYAVSAITLVLAIASTDVWAELGAGLALIFIICMICHGEVVRVRPVPEHLTSFYLSLAGGGALGGIFVGIVAPALFSGLWEFHLAVMCTGLLILIMIARQDDSFIWSHPLLTSVAAVVVVLVVPLLGQYVAPEVGEALNAMRYYKVSGILCAILLPWSAMAIMKPRERLSTMLGPASAAMLLLIITYGLFLVPWGKNGETLVRTRNFYGVLEAQSGVDQNVLMHGKTVHGSQWKTAAMRRVPTTYYGVEGGLGQFMIYHPKRNPVAPMRIGVVGMGVGTIAAYGVPGDFIRFYELDPGVLELAAGPKSRFTYLNDSAAKVDVVLGDGRLSLERELRQGGGQNYDVLVLDAFNGDTIPVHLLTVEAMELYLKHLAPDGVLAVHVSSTTIDLSPVLLAAAEHLQLNSVMTRLLDRNTTVSSVWVFLSKTPKFLQSQGLKYAGTPLDIGKRPVLWTDDYTNIVTLFYR